MKTRAIRLYGARDLHMDEYEIENLREDEILASVVSDSICMSTYKAVMLGTDHKRVPADIARNPVVIGHEFAGKIVAVGAKWAGKYRPGAKFAIQPNINSQNKGYAPGYSFTDFGGNAEYIRIPAEVMEKNALLSYTGNAYYKASLAEPLSCIIAAFKASFHSTAQAGEIIPGIKSGGQLAILAGAGPMGMGAIDYALHGPVKPARIVVTDIDEGRLKRTQRIFSKEDAAKSGIDLVFLNTKTVSDAPQVLRNLTDGAGFDDIFIFAPVAQVIETADQVTAKDCCINFFAGPTDKNLSARVNFYNVHYMGCHIVGTSGGSNRDMEEAIELISSSAVNPSVMLTHIGGLDSVISSVLNLPNIPGGKKLIYNHIRMPLTEIGELGKISGYERLGMIVEQHNGLWCEEAEKELFARRTEAGKAAEDA